ncbi:hypothetical protein R6Q59_022838 [Mikania micrantha]
MEDYRRRDSSSPPVIADLSVTQRCEYSKIRLRPIENSEKTTWTNEKHDMYLDHLESSFVEQLHQSALKNHPRCAGKQSFVTKMLDSSNAMNLCTQYKNNFFNEIGSSTEKFFERHGESLGYFEEYSDQNFPDEASEQMCVTTMSKRSKTRVS